MKALLTVLFSLLTMCSTSAQYFIGLTGVANARQLGGYRICDKEIKSGELLRTGNLSSATDADLELLEHKYRVACVFDFRTSYERDASPDRELRDCENVWLPCLGKYVKGMKDDASSKSAASGGNHSPEMLGKVLLANIGNPELRQMADSMYMHIAFDEEVQGHYASFLQRLATLPEGRSVLWHCTQGKDRAGCASAFLLAALGADRQLIVEDFARSNDSYRDLVDRLVAAAKAQGHSDDEINVLYALVGVSVPLFEKMLDAIDLRYGSLDNYLTTALQCDEALRQKLRQRFLK